MLDEWAARSPSREVALLLNRPGLGIARNFSQAILATTSELVALSDQDDLWRPERLARLADRFDAEPDLTLLHGDARLVDDDGNPLGTTLFEALHLSSWERSRITDGRAFDVLLRRNVVTGATTMFRRSLADAALPVADGWIHDEWLAVVAAVTGRVDLIADVLVDYRQHDTNAVGATPLDLRGRIRKLREPREDRNRHLAKRARELLAWVEKSDVAAPGVHRAVQHKLRHESERLRLPRRRVLRIPRVVRHWVGHDYARYGLGIQDVLRDVVQPAD